MRISRNLLISTILAVTGVFAIVLSILVVSSILSLIGLALLFWGIILVYIRTEDYVKKSLLESVAFSQQDMLSDIIRELQYDGDLTYLPPQYFEDLKMPKLYISRQRNVHITRPNQKREDELGVLDKNLQGLLLTPSGLELSSLFERVVGTDFALVNLQYLQHRMPRLFIEDLEISQGFKMEIEKDRICIKIRKPVFGSINTRIDRSPRISSSVDSPLSSAIACTLAKTTGKPIKIENQRTSKDEEDLIIEYLVLNEHEST